MKTVHNKPEKRPAWRNIFSWAGKNFFLGREIILPAQGVYRRIIP